MKNKGFTLVELIAVIVILSILISLSVGIYFNVQKNILEYEYKNVIANLETEAEAYAFEMRSTDRLNVSVEYLIKEGYIHPDDNEFVYDPRDGSIMNCYMIEIIFKENHYEATFGKEEKDEQGNCSEENVVTGGIEIFCNNRRCEDGWYNEDVTLSIYGVNAEELVGSKVEWHSLQGNHYETNTVLVSPSGVLNTTFTATIKTNKDTYRINKDIKIDKEAPIVFNEYFESSGNWVSENYFNFEVSDKNGSGLAGYAIINNSDCKNATYINDVAGKYRFSLDNGTYYICAKDKAGNIGIGKEIKFIDNIDKIKPSIDVSLPTSKAIVNVVTITFTDNESGISAYKFDDGEWIDADNQNTLTITHTYEENGTYTIYVRDNAGNVESKIIEIVNVEKSSS